MAIAGSWARVFVDSRRCLVYGPRLGRVYLLDGSQALDENLRRVLGLGPLTFCADLSDPAKRIVHDLSSLRGRAPLPAPITLRILYRLLHYSRRGVPFGLMIKMVRGAAKGFRSPRLTVSEIGLVVHAIECATGLADCYPRALLTTYLCLKNRHSCNLTLGTLAPTRKMHAWCSSGGELPYEAMPEHYMYCPLLVLTLA